MTHDRPASRPLAWQAPLLLMAAGLYCTRGVLDVLDGASGPARVAMLPPLWELAGFAVLFAGVALIAARRGVDAGMAAPLAGLALLAVPYLPWLPDRVPLLRALAGPGRDLLWMVAAWLVAAAALRGSALARAARASAWTIFAASLLVYGVVAWRLSGTAQFPGGDEPHYLVITQSLLRDGDFKIENNHQRGDYREYFNRTLKPDYLARGRDGQIYSIHPVGLPVLAMPAYALAGYRGVVAMLVLMAAMAAALMWTLARDVSGSPGAATFAWAASALTAPYLFNSFTVYPEIPGALALLVALVWRRDSASPLALAVRGLALGALPWLSTKYAPMAAVALAVCALRVGWRPRAIAALVLPVAASLVGWFAFFHAIWGTFSPSAPYGSSEPMTLTALARGGPGLLFDQEYGVIAYAPVLAIAIAGFVGMLRSGREQARRAWELAAVFGALLVTVGAFHVWWGGTAAPGRPLASGVLLLGVPIAALMAGSVRSSARAVSQVLLAASLAVAVVLAITGTGILLHNDRDGTATFLDWLSPAWSIAAAFPSFIAGPVSSALLRVGSWLALGLAVAALGRTRRTFGGGALTTLVAGVTGAVVLIAALSPRVAPMAPSARARVPLLDRFDAHRRPLTVAYEPMTIISPADALSRVNLIARPGERTAPQPVDLLWNARFALPAGEYRVHLQRNASVAALSALLGLQVGAAGPPIETWSVSGPAWDQSFVLPVDANLVGLRAVSPAGLVDGELRLSATHVLDESRRVERPPVVAVRRYGAVTAYFHDDFSLGETGGFWTRGRAETPVTFVTTAAGPGAIALALRCGSRANAVTLSTPGWQTRLAVAAGGTASVSVPAVLEPELGIRLAPATISVQDGFVPAEVDAGSTDRRLLGCWIDLADRADPRSGGPR